MRIYPVFLLSLLLSYFVASCVSRKLHHVDCATLAGNLLMVQRYEGARLGSWCATFLNNEPLWSLAYEWWFYMAFFPIHRYLGKKTQDTLVFAVATIGCLLNFWIPNQASMVAMTFPIWWTGVQIADAVRSNGPVWKGVLPSAIMMALLLVLITARLRTGGLTHAEQELLSFQSALFKDAFKILLVGQVVSAVGLGSGRIWKSVGALSRVSYSLYLFHFPVLIQGAALADRLSPGLRLCALTTVLAVLCYVSDVVLQPRIRRRVFGMRYRLAS